LPHFFLFFLMLPLPPSSPLFPYTTLFRSAASEPARLIAQIFRIACSDPGEFAQRSRQMGAQMLLGFVRIAGLDRLGDQPVMPHEDRKSTRLNSSHSQISYAVFCLKKKKKN